MAFGFSLIAVGGFVVPSSDAASCPDTVSRSDAAPSVSLTVEP